MYWISFWMSAMNEFSVLVSIYFKFLYSFYVKDNTSNEIKILFFILWKLMNIYNSSGRPKPIVRWFQSGIPLATASEVSSGSTVTSSVLLETLGRSDNGLLLTCEASNNNISKPVRHSVSMLMNRKFLCIA